MTVFLQNDLESWVYNYDVLSDNNILIKFRQQRNSQFRFLNSCNNRICKTHREAIDEIKKFCKANNYNVKIKKPENVSIHAHVFRIIEITNKKGP